MSLYKYSEARQNFASLLEEAFTKGEVKIQRKDGTIFVLRPIESDQSPLDVKALNLDLSETDIVDAVRAGRKPKSA